MDVENLIERLKECSTYGFKQEICGEAADALSTIQAENAKLLAELEKVKAEFEEERAAVVDVDKAISWLKDYVFWEQTNSVFQSFASLEE